MVDIFFFFFNDTATTEIYTLSLHDALPILAARVRAHRPRRRRTRGRRPRRALYGGRPRSEEHTSELQSQSNLVCRLLLEKKKTAPIDHAILLHLSIALEPSRSEYIGGAATD